MKKILIIDDDQDVLALLRHTLSREFELTFAETISDGEGQVSRSEFDLIVLDEVLPDGLGSELCQRIKNTQGKETIPVVMLTQRKELKDKLNAFDAGADDYIRSQVLNLVDGEGNEKEIALTPIEFKILYHLSKEEGVVRSRAELLELVWGKNQNVIDRTVDQHVSKLRKKIEESRMTVKSLHKKGYLLALGD